MCVQLEFDIEVAQYIYNFLHYLVIGTLVIPTFPTELVQPPTLVRPSLCSALLTAITVSFGSPPTPVTVLERVGALADICVDLTDVPAGGVECPFDIIIEPTAMIDAGKH